MNTNFRHMQAYLGSGFLAVAALALFAAAAPSPAGAFEAVVVSSGDLKPYQDAIRGVQDACECEVKVVKWSDDEGIRKKILRQAPDAVVTVGTTVFAKFKSIRNLPVVYVLAAPWETADTLLPNMSGVNMNVAPDAYISAMKQVFPHAKKVGLLYDPRHSAAFVAEAAKSASAAGLGFDTVQVRDPREIPPALQALGSSMDVFWLLPDPTIITDETIDYLFLFSFQRNVPVFSFSRKYLARGAVAALDVDPYEMGIQAGEIIRALTAGRTRARRVYAGAGRLMINRNMAAKMGLRINADRLEGEKYVK